MSLGHHIMRDAEGKALTQRGTVLCSAMSVLAYSAIMDGQLEVEPQTWVLAATRDQLNQCHEPSQYLIWTSRYWRAELFSRLNMATCDAIHDESTLISDPLACAPARKKQCVVLRSLIAGAGVLKYATFRT